MAGLGCPLSFRDLASFTPLRASGWQACAIMPDFWGEIQTRVLMIAWQVLFQLSHCPHPTPHHPCSLQRSISQEFSQEESAACRVEIYHQGRLVIQIPKMSSWYSYTFPLLLGMPNTDIMEVRSLKSAGCCVHYYWDCASHWHPLTRFTLVHWGICFSNSVTGSDPRSVSKRLTFGRQLMAEDVPCITRGNPATHFRGHPWISTYSCQCTGPGFLCKQIKAWAGERWSQAHCPSRALEIPLHRMMWQ